MPERSQPPTSLILLIAFLTPVALGIVVPGLADIARAFEARPSEIQFLVSAFVLGLGVAQLILGPLADAFGRKRVLLICFSGFSVASFACAFAPTLEWLIVGRLVQAIGAAAGGVIVRTIIADSFEPKRAAQMMSYMAASIEVGLLVSAPIGGRIVANFGWPPLFFLVGGLGVFVVLAVAIALPETRGTRSHQPFGLKILIGNYLEVLRLRKFLGYVLVLSAGIGAGMGLYTIFPLVMSDHFNLSATTIGDFLFVNGLAMIGGALLAARISRIFGIDKIILATVISMVMLAVVFLGIATGAELFLAGVLAPLFLMSFSRAILMPICFTGAVSAHSGLSGTASGLAGSAASILMAFSTAAMASLYAGTLLPPAIAMLALVSFALIVYAAFIARQGAARHR